MGGAAFHAKPIALQPATTSPFAVGAESERVFALSTVAAAATAEKVEAAEEEGETPDR